MLTREMAPVLAKAEDHIANALAKGAAGVKGGPRSDPCPIFFQPRLLTGLTKKMDLAHEETSGPLATLVRFETEEQTIAWADISAFGLAGFFHTRDLGHACHVGVAHETAAPGANTGVIATEPALFCGVKQSRAAKAPSMDAATTSRLKPSASVA